MTRADAEARWRRMFKHARGFDPPGVTMRAARPSEPSWNETPARKRRWRTDWAAVHEADRRRIVEPRPEDRAQAEGKRQIAMATETSARGPAGWGHSRESHEGRAGADTREAQP